MNNSSSTAAVGTTEEETTDSNMTDQATDSSPGKQIVISIAEGGSINVDFNGNLQTHEVFGALMTTLMDIGVQNFINPNLLEVMKSVKVSEEDVIDAFSKDRGMPEGDSDKVNSLVSAIRDVAKEFGQ